MAQELREAQQHAETEAQREPDTQTHIDLQAAQKREELLKHELNEASQHASKKSPPTHLFGGDVADVSSVSSVENTD